MTFKIKIIYRIPCLDIMKYIKTRFKLTKITKQLMVFFFQQSIKAKWQY